MGILLCKAAIVEENTAEADGGHERFAHADRWSSTHQLLRRELGELRPRVVSPDDGEILVGVAQHQGGVQRGRQHT